jgi:hypothetical protein
MLPFKACRTGLASVFILLFAGNPGPATAQYSGPPKIVQRERNDIVGAKWALARRGNLLITSSREGTEAHVWSGGKFNSVNRSIDKPANDFVHFASEADLLLIGSSPGIAQHQRLMKGKAPLPGLTPPADAMFPGDVPEAMKKSVEKALKSRPSANKDPLEIRLFANPDKMTLSRLGSIELQPTTNWLTVSGDATKVVLYDGGANTLEIVRVAEGFNTPSKRWKDVLYPTQLHDMTLSAKGGHLLVAQELRLSLIDTDSGKLIQAMPIPENWRQLRFSYGGRYLVAKQISEDQVSENKATAIVMEVTSGRILEFPIDAADLVHVTPDGQWLVRINSSELEFTKLANRNEKYSELLHDDCNRNCDIVFAADAGRAVIWSDEPARIYVAQFPFNSK